MRVTEGVNYRNLVRDLARVQERMQTAQLQISSGKRISTPSEDPTAATDVIRLSSEQSEGAQYDRNLLFARTKLNAADGVLDSVEQMVQRVRTLAQLGIGNPASAALYTTEISGIRDQIINTGNTAVGGRFIFGGSVTTQPPFLKAADSSVTYQGNSQTMAIQATRTSTLQTQIPGNEIFTGSVDIFAEMSRLVTAMNAGDKAAMFDGIKKLEDFSKAVSVARSKVGGYLNMAATFENELTSARLSREANLTEIQAADLAKAISEFQLSENSMEATMAIGGRLSQINLLDYL